MPNGKVINAKNLEKCGGVELNPLGNGTEYT